MTEQATEAHAQSSDQGMQSFKVAIVTAVHIQPSKAWVDALNHASKTATIIVVDDSDGKVDLPGNWDVYGYDRQHEILGDEKYARFEVFHKSSSCKTFGLWLAYERGFDPIIVIDSDCIIPPDFVGRHIEALLNAGDGWDNPLKGTGFYSRGFPYHERRKPLWAHMGLWENELDLYGTDRVGVEFIPKAPARSGSMSTGAQFPLSGMNVSFRNEAAPYMMFLPNFSFGQEKFRRHDDIWGGYIFQTLAKARGFALSYGDPLVFHDTVVVPEEDAAEEEAMIKYEREFYKLVDVALTLPLTLGQVQPTPWQVWRELANFIKYNDRTGPFAELEQAFLLAADIFKPAS